MTPRLTIALVALLLALPAAAFGQGAGDQQYSDPFGPDQQQQSTPTPAPQPQATPVPTQAPSTAAPSSAQATPAPTAAPAPATPSGPQLPYTGVDAGWVALAGALL